MFTETPALLRALRRPDLMYRGRSRSRVGGVWGVITASGTSDPIAAMEQHSRLRGLQQSRWPIVSKQSRSHYSVQSWDTDSSSVNGRNAHIVVFYA